MESLTPRSQDSFVRLVSFGHRVRRTGHGVVSYSFDEGPVTHAKTRDFFSSPLPPGMLEDAGGQGEKRRIGGWLCDTRTTPANGRAEPGRQTIDICVQNGRQERHPPHSTSPFVPVSRITPLSPLSPPPPARQPRPSPPSRALYIPLTYAPEAL